MLVKYQYFVPALIALVLARKKQALPALTLRSNERFGLCLALGARAGYRAYSELHA